MILNKGPAMYYVFLTYGNWFFTFTLDIWFDGFSCYCYSCCHSSTAHRNKDGIQLRNLVQKFCCYCSLQDIWNLLLGMSNISILLYTLNVYNVLLMHFLWKKNMWCQSKRKKKDTELTIPCKVNKTLVIAVNVLILANFSIC